MRGSGGWLALQVTQVGVGGRTYGRTEALLDM